METFAGDRLWDAEGVKEGCERAGVGNWDRLAYIQKSLGVRGQGGGLLEGWGGSEAGWEERWPV